MIEENIDYNAEPVFYCKHCLSLNIQADGYLDFCGNCGSTDIEKTTLEEYDELHSARFGTKVFYK